MSLYDSIVMPLINTTVIDSRGSAMLINLLLNSVNAIRGTTVELKFVSYNFLVKKAHNVVH